MQNIINKINVFLKSLKPQKSLSPKESADEFFNSLSPERQKSLIATTKSITGQY